MCDLLGIEQPIIQAGMGEFTSAELVAAVSNACGLGSLGTAYRAVDEIAEQFSATQELTDRPFVVNHLMLTLDEDAIALTLKAKPTAEILHQMIAEAEEALKNSAQLLT